MPLQRALPNMSSVGQASFRWRVVVGVRGKLTLILTRSAWAARTFFCCCSFARQKSLLVFVLIPSKTGLNFLGAHSREARLSHNRDVLMIFVIVTIRMEAMMDSH